MISPVRDQLDQPPETAHRQLIVSGDGSYTNGSVLKNLPPRTTFIGRIRKDAKLFLPLAEPSGSKSSGRRRRYGPPVLTPEQVLQDESIPLQKVLAFAAGQMREFSLKIAQPVYWRKSASGRPLPLVAIKPGGYRLRNGSKLLDREPAFLIRADRTLAIETLLQA